MNNPAEDVPPDPAETILKLWSAHVEGDLSAADRILEFRRLLEAAKELHTKTQVIDRARHRKVYTLLTELLENIVEIPDLLAGNGKVRDLRFKDKKRALEIRRELIGLLRKTTRSR